MEAKRRGRPRKNADVQNEKTQETELFPDDSAMLFTNDDAKNDQNNVESVNETSN